MNRRGKPMRLVLLAVLTAAAALAAAPADAASKKRVAVESSRVPQGRTVARRAPTRITVTGRSYLDPGTEVYPNSQSYRDYVFSPLYQSPSQVTDPTLSRSSLPPPLWIPSYHMPSWGD